MELKKLDDEAGDNLVDETGDFRNRQIRLGYSKILLDHLLEASYSC